jgi:serine/threonine-protein kinase
MGAIHRDISPDNVMLEHGQVERAKLIDFGIAKDLDPTAGTIVGDGFAGKLNYVAPEQLGEFGREIGPWTDVYSLGLTILAVALGREVDMGGTIVDAVDKRRAGPDLTAVPADLRPLLERMLTASPQQRMRSMDEVVEWLERWSRGSAKSEPQARAPRKPGALAAPQGGAAGFGNRFVQFVKQPRGAMIVGGGALGALLLFAVVLSFVGGNGKNAPPGDDASVASRPIAQRFADPAGTARGVLANGLARVPCSWLDVESVDGGNGSPVSIALKGVAGNSAAMIAQVEAMLKNAGVGEISADYSDIAPVPNSFCGQLEAFGHFRSPGTSRLSVPRMKFEMSRLTGDQVAPQDNGRTGAIAVLQFDFQGIDGRAALVGIGEQGEMDLVTDDVKSVKTLINEGNEHYRLDLPTFNAGWSGMVLIVGNPPFERSLFHHERGTLDPDWAQRFTGVAQAQGWKTDMIWYQAVDEQPDAAASQ